MLKQLCYLKVNEEDAMKNNFTYVFILSMVLITYTPVRCQSDLKERVQRVLLYQTHADPGEKYKKKTMLKELGREAEVQAILLKMVEEHKHSEPGTEEYQYLLGATLILGEMRAKQAIDSLSRLVSDQNVSGTVRASAIRSLGKIDAKASKELLLTALANVSADRLIRIFAAEALAKTDDSQVLRVMERYSHEEENAYVRQKLEKAVQELRARVQSPR